jgi:hypothetical protein
MLKIIEHWLDKLFGFDKVATKDDIKRLLDQLEQIRQLQIGDLSKDDRRLR